MTASTAGIDTKRLHGSIAKWLEAEGCDNDDGACSDMKDDVTDWCVPCQVDAMLRTAQAESQRDWKEAYERLLAQSSGVARIELDDGGSLDELVAHGVLHVECMDDAMWSVGASDFGMLFTCSDGKIKALPRDYGGWAEARAALTDESAKERIGYVYGRSDLKFGDDVHETREAAIAAARQTYPDGKFYTGLRRRVNFAELVPKQGAMLLAGLGRAARELGAECAAPAPSFEALHDLDKRLADMLPVWAANWDVVPRWSVVEYNEEYSAEV